jgi:hypothetical protein
MNDTTHNEELDAIIEQCAKAAHNVNRAYCAALADDSQPSWEEAPAWQRESAINGARNALLGDTTPQDIHESWFDEKIDAGWTWGRKKDPEKKTHPCMLPYDLLPMRQRMKDTIFLAVVSGVFDVEIRG